MQQINNKNNSLVKFAAAAVTVKATALLLTLFSFALPQIGLSQTAATITQPGWYRIAQNGTTLGGTNGTRAAAHFIVMDKTSSLHHTVEFLAYINFHQMPSIVVLNNSYYNATHVPIPKIRILSASNAYAGSAVEVYIDATGNNSESFVMEDNTQTSGWTAIGWQQVSTGTGDQDGVPSGFTAYVLSLKDLITGFVTKNGTQSSYVNGNFYTSGNLLLGKTTQTNSGYKLDINGKARANEVVVNSTGADFVFDPTYRLRPISSIKEYIRTNRRLPEIPSANEMQTNGLSLGENQTRLLEKIEELTLYLISQDDQIQQMKSAMDSLKRSNLQLSTQNKILTDIERRLRRLETQSAPSHPITVKTR